MQAAFALPFAPVQQHRAPPLDLARVVGAAAWAGLTPQARRRFTPGHPPATCHGTLTIRHSWAGALFARLGALLGRPLPLHAGADVPAEAQVRPDGQGGVVWARWLREPGRATACVRSTKHADRNGGVSERTDRLLGMALAVQVEGEALVFESRFHFLAPTRHGWRLRIPALLTPGRCRVEHAPAGPGRFRFTLAMTHPLLGRRAAQPGAPARARRAAARRPWRGGGFAAGGLPGVAARRAGGRVRVPAPDAARRLRCGAGWGAARRATRRR